MTHVLRHCDTVSLVRCAQTTHQLRSLAADELRLRFISIIRHFFGNRTHDFLVLLTTHRGLISGSSALAFLSWPDVWIPGDIDVYVGTDEYPKFVQSLKDMQLAAIEVDFTSQRRSSYAGIASVRRYLTPMHQRLDVIRSATSNAAHPLLYFWGSLVVNFLTSRGAVCAFPAHTLNRKALVTDISYSEKLVAARNKYESRGFQFQTVDSWRPSGNNNANGSRVFSERPILAINFLSVWPTDLSSLPIIQAGSNWLLRSDYPIGISGK